MLDAQIDGIDPDGTRRKIHVILEPPYHSDEGCWYCPTHIDGLHNLKINVAGEDSIQSLCLALSLVKSELDDFVSRGGRLFHAGTDCEYEFQSILNTEFGKPS
jgi:hypothetical protein